MRVERCDKTRINVECLTDFRLDLGLHSCGLKSQPQCVPALHIPFITCESTARVPTFRVTRLQFLLMAGSAFLPSCCNFRDVRYFHSGWLHHSSLGENMNSPYNSSIPQGFSPFFVSRLRAWCRCDDDWVLAGARQVRQH